MTTLNYDKLRLRLNENKFWPLRYMFKFIVPNEQGKVEVVKKYMPVHGILSFKHTHNLKYVSITCVVYMPTADSIVDITSKVTQVEGVIAL